jgi:mRNA-degrading endonuclease toxin of MazEF toxin-antitoxin module
MRVQRGDIVLLPIAFTTGSGGKVRPALVVQSDHNNTRLNTAIVAIITKTTHRATTEATQLLIDVRSPEGQRSELLHTSAIKREHLVTVATADINRVIGTLPPATMTRIDACLRASLALH